MEMKVSKLNGLSLKDSEAVHFYNNIESMKSDTTIKNGMVVSTLGYHSINDGGSADYLIRTKSDSDIEDLGSIHFINDSLVAVLVSENINVKQFGAIGDYVNDDTLSIQNAINYCLINNIGKLTIPNGKYIISSTLTIKKLRDKIVNFTIRGDGKPQLIPADSFNGVNLILIDSEIKSGQLDNIMRFINIENIAMGIFHGSETETSAEIRGIEIRGGQYFHFENLSIRHCLGGGIKLVDVMDSYFSDIHIYKCGIGSDLENSSTPASGLWLTAKYDNSNANKFNGVHIEYSKFMLFIEAHCRHNQFANCKFEQSNHEETQDNSMIQVSGSSVENIFQNCQFVKNSDVGPNDANYFITAKEGTSLHESAKFYLKIDGGMFTCSSKAFNKGRWLNVKGVTIINSLLNHCASDTGYPLVFNGDVIFKNNRIVNKSAKKNLISLVGDSNIISSNIIEYTDEESTTGVFLSFSNITKNQFTNNTIKGLLPSPYSGDENLTNNIFKDNIPYNYILGKSEGLARINLLFGTETYVVNDLVNYTIEKIRFGYHGQIVTLIDNGTGGTHNINNANNIVTSTGATFKMEVNKPYRFINVNDTWYQL